MSSIETCGTPPVVTCLKTDRYIQGIQDFTELGNVDFAPAIGLCGNYTHYYSSLLQVPTKRNQSHPESVLINSTHWYQYAESMSGLYTGNKFLQNEKMSVERRGTSAFCLLNTSMLKEQMFGQFWHQWRHPTPRKRHLGLPNLAVMLRDRFWCNRHTRNPSTKNHSCQHDFHDLRNGSQRCHRLLQLVVHAWKISSVHYATQLELQECPQRWFFLCKQLPFSRFYKNAKTSYFQLTIVRHTVMYEAVSAWRKFWGVWDFYNASCFPSENLFKMHSEEIIALAKQKSAQRKFHKKLRINSFY